MHSYNEIPIIRPRHFFFDWLDIQVLVFLLLFFLISLIFTGQDIFLIGRPSPLRRQVAMQYLQLTDREVEYVALSRDTTESDLKQRREIIQGTAHYIGN